MVVCALLIGVKAVAGVPRRAGEGGGGGGGGRKRLIGEQGEKVVEFVASGGASGLGGVSKPGGWPEICTGKVGGLGGGGGAL